VAISLQIEMNVEQRKANNLHNTICSPSRLFVLIYALTRSILNICVFARLSRSRMDVCWFVDYFFVYTTSPIWLITLERECRVNVAVSILFKW